MKTYEWKLSNCSGKIEAENIQEATHKLIDIYFNFPYPGEDIVRVDFLIKEVK